MDPHLLAQNMYNLLCRVKITKSGKYSAGGLLNAYLSTERTSDIAHFFMEVTDIPHAIIDRSKWDEYLVFMLNMKQKNEYAYFSIWDGTRENVKRKRDFYDMPEQRSIDKKKCLPLPECHNPVTPEDKRRVFAGMFEELFRNNKCDHL